MFLQNCLDIGILVQKSSIKRIESDSKSVMGVGKTLHVRVNLLLI